MAAGRIIAVVLFHAYVATVRCANLALATSLRTAKKEGGKDIREVFHAPEMLIFSSPMERKVSYTQLKNFKSVGGVVLPILDAGLMGPYGIAWDSKHSALYICDADLRKILRVKLKAFKCLRACKGLEYHLKIVGNIYTVVEDVVSQWASVDDKGNLFFTDQGSSSINKLPVETIDKLIKDKIMAKDLQITSEEEAEGEEAAKESVEVTAGDCDPSWEHCPNVTTVSTTPQPPSIFRLYETGACEHVGTPAGIAAEGAQLYWTNQVGAFSKGTVVEGRTSPRIKKVEAEVEGMTLTAEQQAAVAATSANDPMSGGEDANEKPTFPSFMIANNTGSAYGIAITSNKIVYTDTSHAVWASSRGTRQTVALAKSLLKPRGVVWDGDNTVYIADQEGNYIVSVPVGLLKENAPVTQTLDIHAPFGIALVKTTDPIWAPLKPAWAGAHRVGLGHSLVMLVVSVVLSSVVA